uniref:Glutamate-rich protein 3 n=1 Tax=Schistocephalus solidus TaxID=70667 RepID=A0A0X3NPH1_SCHSO
MASLNDSSPLENYNSLTDRHLVHFFSSPRIRRHLIQSGLITEDGEVLSESEYRLTQVKREQKHALVDLFAQAVVEKALEVERARQCALRQSLEEICKAQRVRRIREERRRRKQLGSFTGIVSDPLGPAKDLDLDELREAFEELDDSVLVSLDDESRREFNRMLQRQYRIGHNDPHGDNQLLDKGEPPRRSKKSRTRGDVKDCKAIVNGDGIGLGVQPGAENICASQRWANEKQKCSKEQKSLADLMTANQLRFSKAFSGGPILPPVPRHSAEENSKTANGDSVLDSARAVIVSEAALKKSASASVPPKVKGTLKRKSTCFVQLQFLGIGQTATSAPLQSRVPPNAADSDFMRPRQVVVEQQPSGTHTVVVFKGLVKPGGSFSFASRRVPGFSFSLTIYVDGVQDSRISTCCEHRHRNGANIGGKSGHFIFVDAIGSSPCYKCQATAEFKKQKAIPRPPSNQEITSQTTVVLFGPTSSQGDDDFTYSSSFPIDSEDNQSTDIPGVKHSSRSCSTTTTQPASASRVYLHVTRSESLINFFSEEEETALEEIPEVDVCEASLVLPLPTTSLPSASSEITELLPTVETASDYETENEGLEQILVATPEEALPTNFVQHDSDRQEVRSCLRSSLLLLSRSSLSIQETSFNYTTVCQIPGVVDEKLDSPDEEPSAVVHQFRSCGDFATTLFQLEDVNPGAQSVGSVTTAATATEMMGSSTTLLASSASESAEVAVVELAVPSSSQNSPSAQELEFPERETAAGPMEGSFPEISSPLDGIISESLSIETVCFRIPPDLDRSSDRESIEEEAEDPQEDVSPSGMEAEAAAGEENRLLMMPETSHVDCRNDVRCGRIHSIQLRPPSGGKLFTQGEEDDGGSDVEFAKTEMVEKSFHTLVAPSTVQSCDLEFNTNNTYKEPVREDLCHRTRIGATGWCSPLRLESFDEEDTIAALELSRATVRNVRAVF